MTHEDTREAWLLRAVDLLRPIFAAKGHHIPKACMVSCGFASTGTRSHHIARYRERAAALRQALKTHAPQLQHSAAQGGSALWVTGPDTLDTLKLAQDLYRVGVVVEPGAFFYPTSPNHCASMRLGYSSIATERIEPGVQAMAAVLKQHMRRR
jgi:GntR family transcriptional regulator/MocR family aminotransferase